MDRNPDDLFDDIDYDAHPRWDGEPLDLDEDERLLDILLSEPLPYTFAPDEVPEEWCEDCGWAFVPTITSAAKCSDCRRKSYGKPAPTKKRSPMAGVDSLVDAIRTLRS